MTLNVVMATPRRLLSPFGLSLAMIVGQIISECAFLYVTTLVTVFTNSSEHYNFEILGALSFWYEFFVR